MKVEIVNGIQVSIVKDVWNNYNPRLKQIFEDRSAIYVLENSEKNFKVLRIKDVIITHELIISKKSIVFKTKTKECNLKINDILGFIKSLPEVYRNYERTEIYSGFYYPVGNQMDKTEIFDYIYSNLK